MYYVTAVVISRVKQSGNCILGKIEVPAPSAVFWLVLRAQLSMVLAPLPGCLHNLWAKQANATRAEAEKNQA